MDRMVIYKQTGFMLCKAWLAISKKVLCYVKNGWL